MSESYEVERQLVCRFRLLLVFDNYISNIFIFCMCANFLQVPHTHADGRAVVSALRISVGSLVLTGEYIASVTNIIDKVAMFFHSLYSFENVGLH